MRNICQNNYELAAIVGPTKVIIRLIRNSKRPKIWTEMVNDLNGQGPKCIDTEISQDRIGGTKISCTRKISFQIS